MVIEIYSAGNRILGQTIISQIFQIQITRF